MKFIFYNLKNLDSKLILYKNIVVCASRPYGQNEENLITDLYDAITRVDILG